MVSKALLTSAWHEWGTPAKIFGPLQEEFGPFTLDACASAWNAKAPKYFTKEQDGLKQQWSGRVWLNPPYGKGLGEWLGSAWSSTAHGPQYGHAELVVAIVPSRTDTSWWHQWVIGKAEIRFLYGRFRFEKEDGSKTRRCPFPVSVLIYRPKGVDVEKASK